MSLFNDSELINEPIFKSEFDFDKKAKISNWTPCEKRLRSCLIYMGSKEIIAGALLKEIHKHSPNAKYFFDLFGGGGAMSVQALASGLKVRYNELKTDLCLMFEYIKKCITHPRNEWGIFDKEMYFWVDKNEFLSIREKYANKEHLKGAEIIKAFIYSFGAQGISASYAFGIRQWKHAGHNMVFYPFLKDEFEKRGEGLKWCIEVFNKEFTKYYDDLDSEEREFSAFVLTDFMLGDFGSWIERRAFFGSFIMTLEALCLARLQKNWKYEFKQETSARALKEFSKSKLCKIISLKRPDLVATAKKYKQKAQGFSVFISESDGFAEFSGLTPIWHKTKQKGNSRIKKDKSADDYAVMNEYLFFV